MSSRNKLINNQYSKVKETRNVITKKVKSVLSSKSVDPCDPKAVAKKLEGKSPRLKKLGGGAYGDVTLFPVGDNHAMAVKISRFGDEDLEHEYATMALLNRKGLLAPAPYAIRDCGRSIMYYEYANGGDIRSYLRTNFVSKENPVTNLIFKAQLKSIITQVLYNLYKIQKLYPTFRHNDLHLGNVLVSRGGKLDGYSTYNVDGLKVLRKNIGVIAYVHDFGFTDFDQLPNEKVRRNLGTFSEWGMVKNSHPMYDVHLFFNALYQEFKNVYAFAETKKMIKELFHPDYLTSTSRVVQNNRLRPNVKHYIPTIKQILSNPYFIKSKSEQVKNIMSVILDVKKYGRKKVPPKNIHMNKQGELKIKTRKCRLYKKPELQFIAGTKGINIKGMTKLQICDALKKKYVSKV